MRISSLPNNHVTTKKKKTDRKFECFVRLVTAKQFMLTFDIRTHISIYHSCFEMEKMPRNWDLPKRILSFSLTLSLSRTYSVHKFPQWMWRTFFTKFDWGEWSFNLNSYAVLKVSIYVILSFAQLNEMEILMFCHPVYNHFHVQIKLLYMFYIFQSGDEKGLNLILRMACIESHKFKLPVQKEAKTEQKTIIFHVFRHLIQHICKIFKTHFKYRQRVEHK